MLLAALLLATVSLSVRAEDPFRVLFVNSRTSAPYLRFIDRVNEALNGIASTRISTQTLSAKRLDAGDDGTVDGEPDLIVTVGTRAALAVRQLRSGAPVLYTLIPRATYSNLSDSGRLSCPDTRCSAIFIDQPVDRLFAVIAAAFPDRHRIGVLLGPTSAAGERALTEQAEARNLSINSLRISEQAALLESLDDILKRSDLLLAIPDPLVYNRRTAKSILLTTYRYRTPVLGYSKAYADAGAAVSVYSTPEQVAAQTAGFIVHALRHDELPAPQFPVRYRIRLNRHVAESLGLNAANNPALQKMMKDADRE
jgi:ABC-type uncharacterized transport system substrate-binding protein